MKAVQLFLIVLFVAVLSGCSSRSLLGTEDIALAYKVADGACTEKLRRDAVNALSLGRVGADVSCAADGSLQVVVSSESGDMARLILGWHGGIAFYKVVPGVLPKLPEGLVLTPQRQRVQGTDDLYFTGTYDDVRKIERENATNPAGRVLIWRLNERFYRTISVAPTPAETFERGLAVVAEGGGALRFLVERGTPAEAARERLIAEGGTFAIARGPFYLGETTFKPGVRESILVDFGKGPLPKLRANRERAYLSGPILPTLEEQSATPLPPNRNLGTAVLVVPIILSLGWLFYVRRLDRAKPEPVWLLLVTYALGAFSSEAAAAGQRFLKTLMLARDLDFVPQEGSWADFPRTWISFVLFVALLEEGAKLAATFFATRRHEFDEPVDGIVYAMAAALGFATAENVLFFTQARLAPDTVTLRAFVSLPTHMLLAAIWGYGLGYKLLDEASKTYPLFIASVLLHGTFDALAATEGLQRTAVVLELGLVALVVVLFQRTLRRGTVRVRGEGVESSRRLYVRFGRAPIFWASVSALHVTGLLIVLASLGAKANGRFGFGTLAVASGLFILFGVAAHLTVRFMPLDAAVDPEGITFAGRLHTWIEIVDVRLAENKTDVIVQTDDDEVTVGPGTKEIADELVRIASSFRDAELDAKQRAKAASLP